MKRLLQLLLAGMLAWSTQASVMAAENSIEIERVKIHRTAEGYALSSSFSLELSRSLEDAITHGIPVYFTTDVEMARPRWYWLDEKAVNTKHTIRISYNVLTRQYAAVVGSGMQQNFRTLDDALSLVRNPPWWVVADRGDLQSGQTYMVSVRMRLDISQLSKPFQVNAFSNPDWYLSSSWTRFFYTAE